MESAWSASKAKGTYLKARYQRLASRRGKKRATFAIAHTLLIMTYHIFKEQCIYKDLGSDYFDRLNEKYLIKRFTTKIESLGYQVEIKKIPARTQA
jgi:transposase